MKCEICKENKPVWTEMHPIRISPDTWAAKSLICHKCLGWEGDEPHPRLVAIMNRISELTGSVDHFTGR
jgi:hypothetical protein